MLSNSGRMFVRGGSHLIEVIVVLQHRIDELERQVASSATRKLPEPFSVEAEERRQEARGKKRRKRKGSRGGRTTTAEKVAQAVRTEKVYPEGVPEEDCQLSHTRPVWRLENGRAVLVAYEIYRSRGINTARSPASSAVASSGPKSPWPSHTRCTSSGCRSTKYAC